MHESRSARRSRLWSHPLVTDDAQELRGSYVRHVRETEESDSNASDEQAAGSSPIGRAPYLPFCTTNAAT